MCTNTNHNENEQMQHEQKHEPKFCWALQKQRHAPQRHTENVFQRIPFFHSSPTHWIWSLSIIITSLACGSLPTIHAQESPSFPSFPLRDSNYSLPSVGLGVALSFDDTHQSVLWALTAGYRLIDTAADETYANQDTVGLAIQDWLQQQQQDEERAVQRQDIFVTTKLWDVNHGFYKGIRAFAESFQEFTSKTRNNPQYDNYLDLYLMHSPFGGRLVETWDAMLYIQQYFPDKLRSIGVSNFGRRHLQALKDAGRPLPAVNQMELHPLIYQKRLPLIQWCQRHGIQIQAYGSIMLLSYAKWLDLRKLHRMAEEYNKTAAQVLLQWALQHGFAIIPKSIQKSRIEQNIDLLDFTITDQDMYQLDHWGDHLEEDWVLYKDTWNWNPIDEAPVHLGATEQFWAQDYKDVNQTYVAQVLEAPAFYDPAQEGRRVDEEEEEDSEDDEEL